MNTRGLDEELVAKTARERIAVLMRRRRINVGELADRVGVHRNTISAILNDRLNETPKPETVQGIARELGVRPEDLWPTPTPEATDADAPDPQVAADSALPEDSDGKRASGNS